MKIPGNKQLKHLRQLAHSLKPVVIIGNNGLTESVLEEIDARLAHHELIKIRINAGDRDERSRVIEQISEKTGAVVVMTIGHIAGFYRPAEHPVIMLPK